MASQEQEPLVHPMCTICHDFVYPDEPTEICFNSKCSQNYHRSCIFNWLNQNIQISCPCCRTDMTELLENLESLNLPIQETRQNNDINVYALSSDSESELDSYYGSTCPCS